MKRRRHGDQLLLISLIITRGSIKTKCSEALESWLCLALVLLLTLLLDGEETRLVFGDFIKLSYFSASIVVRT